LYHTPPIITIPVFPIPPPTPIFTLVEFVTCLTGIAQWWRRSELLAVVQWTFLVCW
jgi:hypothetical protein